MAKAAKPKQTWTSNEVKALIDAVKHHGIGKWKAILDDPVYSSALGNRSNVDLKDKWRNICGSENGPTRGMMTERTSRRSSKKRRAPPYDDMIFEPLRSFKDPNGTDLDGIDSYPRVHERYKRKDGETSQAGDDAVAVIIDNRDKEQAGPQNVIYFCQDLNEEPVEQVGPLNLNKELVEPTEPLPAETQDAASAAAVQIAMSENLESRVIKAYQDKNKLADLVDESVAMLMLVKDLYDKCRRNGTVILPP